LKNKQTKYISKEEGLAKLQKYCAYQERCHQEVRTKLINLRIFGDDLEEIISDLIAENFLNEERFARSYARGKFRMRRWGRNRIVKELKFRKITEYCIRKAMTEIDEEEYLRTLNEIILKKEKYLKEKDPFKAKNKLAKYAMSRGFETEYIWEILNRKK
jgi:regulatory protein